MNIQEDLKDYQQALDWLQTLEDESPFQRMHKKALQNKAAQLMENYGAEIYSIILKEGS